MVVFKYTFWPARTIRKLRYGCRRQQTCSGKTQLPYRRVPPADNPTKSFETSHKPAKNTLSRTIVHSSNSCLGQHSPRCRAPGTPTHPTRCLRKRVCSNDQRIIFTNYDGTGGSASASAAVCRTHAHTTTQEARTRPRRAPRNRRRRLEIGSRAGGSRAQRRHGAGTRAAEHPRLLPTFRIEGPAGCGRLSRNDAQRGDAAENQDVGSHRPD